MKKEVIDVKSDFEKINLIRDIHGEYETIINIIKPNSSLLVNEIFNNTKGRVFSSLKVNHLANNTTSRLKIKGVVPSESKAVSRSVVNVSKEFIDCDTDLSQKFLVLSESSFAEAEPALEIEPAKVKAAHDLSISPISPEEIFYLQTRGLSESEARKTIIENFLKI
jgi:Fe-S cluster assembly scaffold protein SufB